MTKPIAVRRWQSARLFVHLPFLGVGALLTFYIGIAAFGLVKNSSEHYSNFILGTCLMAGLLALRNLIEDRIRGARGPWFWARLVFAAAALLLGAIALGYIRLNAVHLERVQPFFTATDMAFGWIMIVAILMLTLIHWGWLLTLVVTAAIVYFFYGYAIPSVLFMTPKYDTGFVLNYIGLGTNQGFFYLAQIAADAIYFLIIYAAILLGVGMLDMVLEVGKLTGRRMSGGAAGPAIIGSGIVASIMGQAVSNVVLTGRLTIPMMKRYGYSGAMAGAIEATASTAGQIMPPILGLAAFIIASFLNRPYIDVALSAMIPGLLYLVGVSIGVAVYAKRYDLPRLAEIADRRMILRLLPTFLVSFGAVLWLLLGYRSPAIAGLWGILLALALCLFQGPYRPSLKALYAAAEEGLVLVAVLSLLLIAVGPLGQVMLTTNLSGRLGAVLVQYLPDSQLLLLIGAMIVSLLLGMGLPTPVAYIIVALALVPFMQQIGVPPLQAHFFVFYFAVFSTLTPPVAVSVLAAGKLAQARFLTTAKHAMKLALTTFIIPFAFVFSPELMSFPNLSWPLLWEVSEVVLIQWIVSVAAYGHCFRVLGGLERAIFAAAGLLGFLAMTVGEAAGHWYWHAALLGLTGVLILWALATRRRAAAPAE